MSALRPAFFILYLESFISRLNEIRSIESRYFWGTQYIESDIFFVNVDTFYKNIASFRTPRDMLARQT